MARYYKKRRSGVKRRRYTYGKRRYSKRSKVSKTMRNFGAIGRVSVAAQLNGDIRVLDTTPSLPLLQIPNGEGISGGQLVPCEDQWNSNAFRILNGVEQGVGITNRIGANIRMKSLQLKLTIKPNNFFNDRTMVDGEYVRTRVLVVYDRQTNGSAITSRPLVLASFGSADGTVNSNDYVTDGINMYSKKRFLVLMDEMWVLPPVVAQGGTWPIGTSAHPVPGATPYIESFNGKGQGGVTYVERFINLKGLSTEYEFDRPNEKIFDMIRTGGLWLIAQSDYKAADGQSLPSNGGPYMVDFQARLRFYQ